MTTVGNIRNGETGIYIGRAGHGQDGYFGNPHSIGWCQLCRYVHDRNDALKAFKAYFLRRVNADFSFRKRVLALKGQKLICFCSPKRCHGHIIAEWINETIQTA